MSKTSQLSQRFRHAIEQGHLRPGDRMPSLRKLCLDHKVSITTAQRAYAELEKQGLIESLPRSGFRVLGLSSLSLRQAPPLPDHPGEFRAEHLTMALPMPWGCPFMNPVLINTTPLTRALTRALSDYRYALSSTDSEGYEGLRRELALRYLAQGVELDGEEMLITCGGMEALNLAIRAVARLSGSDCMLVITPAFPPIFEQLEQLALRPVGFNCPPGQPLDLERLEALLIQHQPAAIIAMPNFQHPTGQVMSDSQKAALLALAERHRVPIIEDDTYRELYFGEGAPLPLKAFDQRGSVLHCSSFSKSLAPGYRVGWIAAGRFRDSVMGLKLCSSLATPLPSQMALARLLAGGHHEDMLSLLRQRLQNNLAALQQQIATHFPADCRMALPLGGYFLWVELPPGVDCRRLLPMAMQQGLHFAPSQLFHTPGQDAGNAMRLNFSFYDPLQQRSGVPLLAELLSPASAY
ncbi:MULTISPECIES: PLP-dependent aminotransferase family protein [Chromobacterium]|uniref:Putative 8-amino-7-oxononanoate synthase n=1 Tax=Chromobacterium aquaticum TaxID=467180 RepID=A0ABV8ZQ43_9NEIS|nr:MULTISPECIES: PLP-dependent aminotransferase family protein [Chromobacterium]KMN35505.1 hypothetical protein VI26_11300 [Chromobacterium sp. LK1]MCD5362712.1 PLP-dependent aminotransferase family protein [Chromobacterium aquaticum]